MSTTPAEANARADFERALANFKAAEAALSESRDMERFAVFHAAAVAARRAFDAWVDEGYRARRRVA